ncbi:MerC domain-containing protein [Edaphobacter modestus]|uniref:MerC mercury resistance protein n=1 Tax=Edaphobacter modestus TaxID=388466 RepID=A0A4Q7YUZ3_9BACT|nr:MerC domain-containing protein [Edaphobacter modestus]RZU40931.1 MerC mercury resistance protein [Edaphobacter modestus]
MGTLLHSSQTHLRRYADLAGAAASGVCLIHCLLTPVVISLFPDIIPYLPGDAWFHRALAIGIVMLGAAAFAPGYRIHRRHSLLALIGAGISLILIVAWAGETLSHSLELILSVTGSAMLVAAHLLNHSFCRQCRSCKDLTRCQATNL